MKKNNEYKTESIKFSWHPNKPIFTNIQIEKYKYRVIAVDMGKTDFGAVFEGTISFSPSLKRTHLRSQFLPIRTSGMQPLIFSLSLKNFSPLGFSGWIQGKREKGRGLCCSDRLKLFYFCWSKEFSNYGVRHHHFFFFTLLF